MDGQRSEIEMCNGMAVIIYEDNEGNLRAHHVRGEHSHEMVDNDFWLKNPDVEDWNQYRFEIIYPMQIREDALYTADERPMDRLKRLRAPRHILAYLMDYIGKNKLFPLYDSMYLSPPEFSAQDLCGMDLEAGTSTDGVYIQLEGDRASDIRGKYTRIEIKGHEDEGAFPLRLENIVADQLTIRNPCQLTSSSMRMVALYGSTEFSLCNIKEKIVIWKPGYYQFYSCSFGSVVGFDLAVADAAFYGGLKIYISGDNIGLKMLKELKYMRERGATIECAWLDKMIEKGVV